MLQVVGETRLSESSPLEFSDGSATPEKATAKTAATDKSEVTTPTSSTSKSEVPSQPKSEGIPGPLLWLPLPLAIVFLGFYLAIRNWRRPSKDIAKSAQEPAFKSGNHSSRSRSERGEVSDAVAAPSPKETSSFTSASKKSSKPSKKQKKAADAAFSKKAEAEKRERARTATVLASNSSTVGPIILIQGAVLSVSAIPTTSVVADHSPLAAQLKSAIVPLAPNGSEEIPEEIQVARASRSTVAINATLLKSASQAKKIRQEIPRAPQAGIIKFDKPKPLSRAANAWPMQSEPAASFQASQAVKNPISTPTKPVESQIPSNELATNNEPRTLKDFLRRK